MSRRPGSTWKASLSCSTSGDRVPPGRRFRLLRPCSHKTTMRNPFVWLVRPLVGSPRDLGEPSGDLVLARFVGWRRNILILVLVFTFLTGAIDIASKLVERPQPSFTVVLKLEPESGPVEQTLFGDIADVLWLLSFYAM